MNIKSLLLGSAAALLAVSGARAADAVVVAEPEPMEYVRICDVYGAGFYYIPGTETCLKIGGYVRYQIDFSDNDDGWRKLARAELWFDARSETEYGTLTRYIELRGNVYSGFHYAETAPGGHDSTSDVSVLYATITLGGLSLGLYDTLFDADINGEFDTGGNYDSVHYINYTFDAGNGISASVGLEVEDYNVDYVPNVTGKLSIKQGWGGLDLYAAYDDDSTFTGDDEYALKAIATFKASDAITLQAMATYASGLSYYSTNYEWTLGASVKFQANEKLAVTFGGQYLASHLVNDGDDYALGVVIDYNIVKDFDAKLAVNFRDGDNYDSDVDGFLRLTAGF
jgi:hypothetical protein